MIAMEVFYHKENNRNFEILVNLQSFLFGEKKKTCYIFLLGGQVFIKSNLLIVLWKQTVLFQTVLFMCLFFAIP